MRPGVAQWLVVAVGASLWGARLMQRRLTAAPPPAAHAPLDAESIERDVRQWERRVQSDPDGATGRALLASAYLRRFRETGDSDDLLRAEAGARRSLAARSHNNPLGASTLARTLMATHRFAEAEKLGLSQGDKSLIGECALERGDYVRARRFLGEAAVNAPGDPGVLAAQARLAQLTGDRRSAESLYRRALGEIEKIYAAPPTTLAWFHVRLAQCLFERGELTESRQLLERAQKICPSDGAAPLLLSRIARREENISEALRLARASSLSEAALLLAELEPTNENLKAALSEDGARHVHSRALAQFLTNRSERLETALELLRAEWSQRKDVETADALAWALLRAGKPAEAEKVAQVARAAGYDAPIFLLHDARLAEALGDPAAARERTRRACAIDPDLHLEPRP